MELAFVIAIFIIMVAALTPFVKMTREHASNIACADNLRQISLGLHMFAVDNKGAFPQSLRVLYPKYVKDEKAFDCPSSKSIGTPDKPDYEYIAGLTERSPKETAVVYDPSSNHNSRGSNFVRVGGVVEWVRNGDSKPK